MFSILRKIFKTGILTQELPTHDQSVVQLSTTCQTEIMRIFGKSLSIQMVDAGSCNGCELEMNALNNCFYDIERFVFISSLHCVMRTFFLVTGPVSRHMQGLHSNGPMTPCL